MKTDQLAPWEQLKGLLILLVWLTLAIVLRGPDRAPTSASHGPVETAPDAPTGAR